MPHFQDEQTEGSRAGAEGQNSDQMQGEQGGLSEPEAKLISAYFDRELSWWGRRKAERLLRLSDPANELLRDLEFGQTNVKEFITEQWAQEGLADSESKELFQRVMARVGSEDHAAMLTRGRKTSDSKFSWGQQLGAWRERFQWGLSGAVVSAATLLFVWGPLALRSGTIVAHTNSEFGSADRAQVAATSDMKAAVPSTEASVSQVDYPAPRVAANFAEPIAQSVSMRERAPSAEVAPAAEVAPVAYNAESAGRGNFGNLSDAIAAALAERSKRDALPMSSNYYGSGGRRGLVALARSPERRYFDASNDAVGSVSAREPRALEVDWMRSQGRVRLFHDPVEKAAYIWINPARRLGAALPSEGGMAFSQAASSVPSITEVSAH